MTARTQIRRFGAPLVICLLALTIHFLGLYVAPMRTELRDVQLEIQTKRRQIAYLEAEFSARASTDRLHRYNELLYGYQPPGADQYLAGENGLAQLGEDRRYAPPVMISVADGPYGAAPKGEIGSLEGRLSDTVPEMPQLSMPIEMPTAQASATTRTASDNVTEKREQAEYKRTERLASLDRQLLSADTLRSISVQADKEQDE